MDRRHSVQEGIVPVVVIQPSSPLGRPGSRTSTQDRPSLAAARPSTGRTVRTPVSGRREAMVAIGRALIDGAVWAMWSRNSTTRSCPAGGPEARACGADTLQHTRAERAATATVKVPRRKPYDLRAAV